jgi:ribosomal protein S12 methylthiotransferase
MRYHLVTLGCPKNVADSDKLEALLRGGYHEPTDRPARADLIVVNTCGFLEAAREESIDTILRLALRKRPGQKLVVAGCLSQIYARQLRKEVPEVDALFGVEAWEQVAALAGPPAGRAGTAARPRHARPSGAEAPFDTLEASRSPRPSAYLKISDGCNAPCAFCIIPRIKGRLHSVEPEALVAEARRLAAQGVQELVLVAQDSTAYGRDRGQHDGLPELLERLAEALPPADGGPWIRVMYAYPGHVSARLARTMASLPQVCHYLDIPLQHASAAVLRRMRRPSNPDRLRQMFARLRSAMPDIALRTTFIVGYPGETEAEFEEMLDFVREMRFDHVGAFVYSPEPGTPAARAPEQVPEAVKRRRYRRLMRLAQEVSLARNQEWVGRELTVLVESEAASAGGGSAQTGGRLAAFGGGDGRRPMGDEVFAGRSYRDAPEVDGLVLGPGRPPPGSMVRVRVERALPYDLWGSPVSS